MAQRGNKTYGKGSGRVIVAHESVSPFSEERKNSSKVNLYDDVGTLLRAYENNEILAISLVQEFYKSQTSIPRSEIEITFNNRDKYFDITNPDSIIHGFDREYVCEAFLSSVKYGDSAEYIKKCKYFYDSFSDEGDLFKTKFKDALHLKKIEERAMVNVANDLPSSAYGNVILEAIKENTKYEIEYEIPEEINSSIRFTTSSLYEENVTKIRDCLYHMAERYTSKLKVPVYLMVNDEGKITFQKQQSEPVLTISKKHFQECIFAKNKNGLISKITDRGNVLYQLGDIIEVINGTQVFKTEIYKIHYTLSKGILSSEWEGVIVQ